MFDTDTSTAAAPPPSSSGALAPPPFLDKYAHQIEDVSARDQAAFDQEQKDLAPRYARLEHSLDAGLPKPPEEKKLEAPPDPASYHKNSLEFASAMAVLGAVAGRFTRNAGNASLNAFAGALKGWQTGNLQAYEEASKQWEQATKQTIENNRMVMDKYKLALENHKNNIDQQMAAIQLIATQYHDKIMFDAAQEKNYTLVANIFEKNQQYTDKAAAAAAKLQEQKSKQDEHNHTSATWLASPTGQQWVSTLPPEQQVKYNAFIQQYGKGVDPVSVHEVATLIGEGKMQPLSSFAMRSPFGQAVMADVQARYPNFSGVGFTTAQSAARATGTRAGQIGVSAEEADATFDLARTASANFPRGQYVPINKLRQLGAQATSNPQYRQFMDANESAVTAYAATMSRSGVNTVAAQERAHKVLDTADSEEAYNAGLDQLQKEVNAVRAAPGRVAAGVQESLHNPQSGNTDSGWGDLKVH